MELSTEELAELREYIEKEPPNRRIVITKKIAGRLFFLESEGYSQKEMILYLKKTYDINILQSRLSKILSKYRKEIETTIQETTPKPIENAGEKEVSQAPKVDKKDAFTDTYFGKSVKELEVEPEKKTVDIDEELEVLLEEYSKEKDFKHLCEIKGLYPNEDISYDKNKVIRYEPVRRFDEAMETRIDKLELLMDNDRIGNIYKIKKELYTHYICRYEENSMLVETMLTDKKAEDFPEHSKEINILFSRKYWRKRFVAHNNYNRDYTLA